MIRTYQHEPTDACADMHCHWHNVDEDDTGAYVVCLECGHVYPTKRALRSAYRRQVAPWRGRVFTSDVPSWRLWWRWLFPPRAGRIWFCQVCSHDF